MKILTKLLHVLSLTSLLLSGICIITYYVIEFMSSFFIPIINMIEIGHIIWTIIFISFACAVVSFALLYIVNKKYN